MIGKLNGLLDSIHGSQVLIDVNGVGYVVTCSARSLRQLGANGTPASLRIETQVREDAISLFGFYDAEEQDWFKLLTTVQGVGAKVALSILGSMSPEQLTSAIMAQDKSAMSQADGVGPKLALRLVTELKDKVPAFTARLAVSGAATPMAAVPAGATNDAMSALINLGYRRAEAFGAVSAVLRDKPHAPLSELIRLALAELSRGEKVA